MNASARTSSSPRRTMPRQRGHRLRARRRWPARGTATHATGGRGNGIPHLPSQNSIVVSPDARFLLVANAGSNDVSVFAIAPGGHRAGRPHGGRWRADEHRRPRRSRLRADDGGERRRRAASASAPTAACLRCPAACASSARPAPTPLRSPSAPTARRWSSASAAPTA